MGNDDAVEVLKVSAAQRIIQQIEANALPTES
jgi:hypothetical protein